MNNNIKQRIEKIRRGEVPEGYKKTKIGIVPEEWEELRFKNIFKRLTRKNTEGNKNVLTISAQYGLINQESFFNKSIASENTDNYFLLRKGEFAYNKSYSNGYPFGAFKRLEKYESGIVSPLYICFSVTKQNRCPEFYIQYFEAGKINSEIKAIAQEGARNHGLLNISVEDFFNAYIVSPHLAEQEKIAEILQTQDKVIKLQQKKIDELKRLKKAYLAKLFPKKGCNVPEIRFPGFTDAWEQRKLGEECEITMGQSPYGSTYSETPSDFILVQGNADLKDGWVFPRIWTTQKTKTAHAGDLIMSVRAPAGAIGKTAYDVVLGRGVAGINGNEFIYQTLVKMDSERYWKKLAAGSTFESVNSDVVKNVELLVPQDIDEQKKIGEYFSILDHLITLHQRKLGEEQKKKKALLQLLLTGIVRVKL